MGKGLIIFGANFFENAVERIGQWYLGCDSSLDEPTIDLVIGWVYDGEARAAIREKTINRVVINAITGGQLDVYLVNYADADTHITGTRTLVTSLNVSPGYNILEIPDTIVGPNQSIGFYQSNGLTFYYGLVPGGPFSPIDNISDNVIYPLFNLNIGLGYVE